MTQTRWSHIISRSPVAKAPLCRRGKAKMPWSRAFKLATALNLLDLVGNLHTLTDPAGLGRAEHEATDRATSNPEQGCRKYSRLYC